MLLYHPLSTILTVGAGAIMPIGTGIIGVPEGDKEHTSVYEVEIKDRNTQTNCMP